MVCQVIALYYIVLVNFVVVSFLPSSVPPAFVVEADKGFNFSHVDESFVCQKKNHFQVGGGE